MRPRFNLAATFPSGRELWERGLPVSPRSSHMFGQQADVACWGGLQGSTCIPFHANTSPTKGKKKRLMLKVAMRICEREHVLYYCTDVQRRSFSIHPRSLLGIYHNRLCLSFVIVPDLKIVHYTYLCSFSQDLTSSESRSIHAALALMASML